MKKNLHVICYALHFICSWSLAACVFRRLFVHVARLLCFLLLEDKCKMSWFPYGWIQSQCKGDTMTTMITHIKQFCCDYATRCERAKQQEKNYIQQQCDDGKKQRQNIKRQKQIRWQCKLKENSGQLQSATAESEQEEKKTISCVCIFRSLSPLCDTFCVLLLLFHRSKCEKRINAKRQTYTDIRGRTQLAILSAKIKSTNINLMRIKRDNE